MEFLKKNWFKLTAAVLFTVALVLELLVVFKGVQTEYFISLKETGLEAMDPTGLGLASAATAGFDANLARVDFYMALAISAFLLALSVYFVLSMFECTKDYRKWAVLGLGLVSTTFIVIVFVNAMEYMTRLREFADAIDTFANATGRETILTGFFQTVNGGSLGATEAAAKAAATIAKLNASSAQILDQVGTSLITRIVSLFVYGLAPIVFALKKFSFVRSK